MDNTIPGIGVITAHMILVDMPEIGALNNKQVASLAGLAPMSQSSDTGRTPQLAQFHLHASAGRDPVQCRPESQIRTPCCCREGEKVAITAVMRKLLVLANALLRDNRKWTEKAA
jgi:transposase